MNQNELNRQVAAAMGETVGTIASMGFSLADPCDTGHDVDPVETWEDLEAKAIDWDALDAERRVPLVLQPAA